MDKQKLDVKLEANYLAVLEIEMLTTYYIVFLLLVKVSFKCISKWQIENRYSPEYI
jgi:hypothetical protein